MTVDEVIRELSGLFKLHFSDEQQAQARVALYRRALGHLQPAQLEAAYGECMKAWGETRPPLPKDILGHVKTSWKPAGEFNMREMCDALPGLMDEIRQSWNHRRGAWAREFIAGFRAVNPGHEEAAAAEVRGLLSEKLKAKAHDHAQKVYRHMASIDSFEIEPHELPFHGKPCQLNEYTIAVREGREPAKIRRFGNVTPRAA